MSKPNFNPLQTQVDRAGAIELELQGLAAEEQQINQDLMAASEKDIGADETASLVNEFRVRLTMLAGKRKRLTNERTTLELAISAECVLQRKRGTEHLDARRDRMFAGLVAGILPFCDDEREAKKIAADINPGRIWILSRETGCFAGSTVSQVQNESPVDIAKRLLAAGRRVENKVGW